MIQSLTKNTLDLKKYELKRDTLALYSYGKYPSVFECEITGDESVLAVHKQQWEKIKGEYDAKKKAYENRPNKI